ncbi:MAG TPA: hypothetical protein PLI96_07920 [Halothiobacillus sp.]|nr:hypothetical protein [Halothiobacillus sp.]
MWTLIKSGISAVFPPAGLALKFGPYAIIAALAAFIMFQHVELQRDAAQIAGASAKCANTQAQAAATVTAASNAEADKQRVSLDASTAALQTATTASQIAGEATLQTITLTAPQPGQDAPIAPVLAAAIAALRSQHGGTP